MTRHTLQVTCVPIIKCDKVDSSGLSLVHVTARELRGLVVEIFTQKLGRAVSQVTVGNGKLNVCNQWSVTSSKFLRTTKNNSIIYSRLDGIRIKSVDTRQ